MNMLEKISHDDDDASQTQHGNTQEFNIVKYLQSHMSAAKSRKVVIPGSLIKNIGL